MAGRYGRIRAAFDKTVRGNEQLNTTVDAALIALGRTVADEIDRAVEQGQGQERTKALYLTPHLMNVLKEMHATPEARRAADVGKEATGGKLADVRQLRSRPAPTKKRTAGG